MPYTLLGSVLLLVACAIVGARIFNLPKNIWLLFVAQPLAMSATSLMVFAGGILGTHLAPSPEMATLPLSVLIVGVALAVIPAGWLTKRVGRRISLMIGMGISILGALLAMLAALMASFFMLILAAFVLGFSMAFVAQMRFAALDSLIDKDDSAKALSILMVGGIFAAIIGPELAVAAKDWLESPHGFAGSFLGLATLLVIAISALSQLRVEDSDIDEVSAPQRPLITIIRQPIFIVALACAAIAYGLMSYIMTATPLSMHMIEHHDLMTTKWVVQSHILAMYIPSLFAALLIRWFGLIKIMWAGVLCYVAVIGFALSGKDVMHYWWTMVLLGVGWNFLFLTGTLSLPKSYENHERLKVQSLNDFTIFVIQGMASLFAGTILFSQGWQTLIVVGIPLVLAMAAIALWSLLSPGLRDKMTSR